MPTPMKSAEFEKLRDEWDLTQALLARFLDVEERTIRRYASEESAIPHHTSMLLRLMKRHKIAPEDAYRLATGDELRT